MDSTFVVGIDVGGQTSKIGVVDARGTVSNGAFVATLVIVTPSAN